MRFQRTLPILSMALLPSIALAQGQLSAQSVSPSQRYNPVSGYTLPTTLSLGAPAYRIATGDLNNDGVQDFVVLGNLEILVVLSQSQLSYAPPIAYATPGVSGGRDILVDDFDGDGNIDIAYITPVGTPGGGEYAIHILPNLGDGSFGTTQSFEVIHPFDLTTFFQATQLTSSDLNNDGLPDIAVATTVGGLSPGDGWLTIVINTSTQGNLSFNDAVNLDTRDGTSYDLLANDVDNDGDQDIVMSHARDNSITVFFNDGSGINGPIDSTTLSGNNGFGPRPLAAGDLNGDGYDDLLFLKYGQLPQLNIVKVLLNLDAGTDPRDAGVFRLNNEFVIGPTQLPYSTASNIFINDFDLDGFNDIAAGFDGTVGSIELLPAIGSMQVLSSNFLHTDVVPVDIEGDGDLDFVSVNGNGGQLSISRNRGQRVFSSRP